MRMDFFTIFQGGRKTGLGHIDNDTKTGMLRFAGKVYRISVEEIEEDILDNQEEETQ